MLLFGALLLCLELMIVVFYYVHRLAGDERIDARRWFWTWAAKGLGFPVLLWLFWNLGILPGLPPLILPMLQAAPILGASRFEIFTGFTAVAFIILSSYWAATSFAWFFAMLAARSDI